MAKLVDALDLGSSDLRHGGSSPPSRILFVTKKTGGEIKRPGDENLQAFLYFCFFGKFADGTISVVRQTLAG